MKNLFRYILTANSFFVIAYALLLINSSRILAGHSFSNFTFLSDQDTTGSDNLGFFSDSTIVNDSISVTDSLSMVDSLAVVDSMAIDSTARIKNFKYKRKDYLSARVKDKRTSGFFVKPSTNLVTKTVSIDSTGEYVEIRQKIGDYEYKSPVKIPLEQYIQMRLNADRRKLWEEQGYSYELKAANKDLGELISEITNIEIPLPSNAFLSIFGEPKISLRINGAVDIYGAWRNETTEGYTASLLGNTKNEPDFRQQVQINVSGTIGDKLEIAADWNTERTFEYENQLKIKYTGYEDEIVQNVEAGNVSLQTSGLVGGSEALFGVKADFQMGPFKLTALASQKKAEIKEKSISSGTTTNDFSIQMIDYSDNHYFVDLVYQDPSQNIFNDFFGNSPSVPPASNLIIDKIEVWKSTTTQYDQGKEYLANAYLELPALGSDNVPNYDNYRGNIPDSMVSNGNAIHAKFAKLTENVDYIVHNETGFITFLGNIQDDDNIAVSYNTVDGPSYGEFEGNFNDKDSTKVFKLIKPKGLKPEFTKAWKLQLRNIYSLGGRDINKEGFDLDIKYLASGKEPESVLDGNNLLQVFGLDKLDESSASNPDQKFDFLEGITIWSKSGDVVFPVLEPFGKDFPKELDEKYKFEEIYTDSKSETRQNAEKNKFSLEGQYSGTASSTYPIGFNVVENSVKVRLNGRELTPGVDYVVDYNIGQVTIRNSEALTPGANLSITYEENDLFSLASKTLLGFRGLYTVNDQTELGFSLLNLNQQTLSDKVRIGEEPLSNTIMGMDFKTQVEMPFLTDGLDKIISTNTMSSLSLRGEVAYMNPDPNTKKSNVESDNNQSIAYLDDFEGAKRTIPIGINYGGWRDISIPKGFSDPAFEGESNNYKMQRKSMAYWYNWLPSDVDIEQIWGNRKSAGRNDQQVTVLDFVYDPNQRGMYNRNPELSVPQQNWGGMMKALSSTASNLVEEKIEFIEFWLRMDNAPTNAEMYIDLGLISEDVIPNNKIDTEDKDPKNDRLEESEDTGIDGLTDAEERLNLGITDPNDPLYADPSNDNFAPITSGYSRLVGTEGNGQDISGNGRIPDTEDLNRNFTLDQVNSYFRYKFKLDPENNKYIVGQGGGNGWYQFRIPLRDAIDSIGTPTLTSVETMRIWATNISQPIHLRFAEINLSGTQWQKVYTENIPEDDSVLTVSTISYEESQKYSIPPGIQREKDRAQTEDDVLKNEQSLLLKVRDLEDGQKREVFKKLYRPLDVFNYKEMKLFIHGEDTTKIDALNPEYFLNPISRYINPGNYASEVYFRFGTDSSNFYEYRQPVQPGWQEITINYEKLTSIKQGRDSTNYLKLVPVEGIDGHYYGVKGLPTLTRVEYFIFGIVNPKNKGTSDPISGDLWVNELRVIGADDTKGFAYTGFASVKFADLMTVNVNYSATDPYFHKLSDRFGSRSDSKNWAASVDFNATKLLPTSMEGSNVRVTYSHSENVKKPLYIPGTDINTEQASQQEKEIILENGGTEEEAESAAKTILTNAQTINTSDTWSLSSLKFVFPSDVWYVEHTINSLSFGFNFNKSNGRSPTIAFSNKWAWNANISYDLKFGRNNYFEPSDIPLIGEFFKLFNDYKHYKIYYTPQNFSAGLSANRSKSNSLNRAAGSKLAVQRDFRATRDAKFSWKMTDGGLLNLTSSYGVDVSSTLAHLLTYTRGGEQYDRSESEIWQDIFKGTFFGKDINYSQTVDLRTSPKLPSLWNIDRYVTIGLGYNVSYTWQNTIANGDLGRGAAYRNNYKADLTLKLKSLMDPLFGEETNDKNKSKGSSVRARGRGAISNTETESDSSNSEENSVKKPSSLINGLNFLKSAVKYMMFDYESINIDFSQSNSFSGGGLASTKPGFGNFWGPFSETGGPSRTFMLGFSNDLGKRAPNGLLKDNFTQENRVSLRTSRPLWEGATLNLDWKVSWGMNKTITYRTDDFGNPSIDNIVSSGKIDRTFFSMPPSLFLSMFKTGIKTVNEKFDPESENSQESLSNAFVEGFESLPLLAKLPFLADVARYIPRPNFSVTWNGLEKFSIFKGFTQRVSLNSGYQSNYSENFRIDKDGVKEISGQRVSYGFSPLLGLNLTFNRLFEGELSGSIRYSTKNNFTLGLGNKTITESFNRDINVSLSYSKSGFELPLFGVSLKNDVTVSLSYTRGQNTSFIYDMRNFNEDIEPQEGLTRTTIEPNIKYVMSSRVTLSVFYRRTSVAPEGASSTPETTTNEAGLEVHISIQ